MLKDISGIKISGGAFVDKNFIFFRNDKESNINMSIVYGKNGSGKSTIARAFRKIKGEVVTDIDNTSIIDKDGVEIQLDSNEKKNIYVFDEKFVNDEIKLKEDGLDTVVLIGKKRELNDNIAECRKNIEHYTSECKEQENKVKENEHSLNNLNIKMQVELSGDDKWSGRDKMIKNNRINTKVNEKTFETFVKRKPNKKRDDLILDFHSRINEINDIRSGNSIICEEVKIVDEQYDDIAICKLLEKRIEEPILNDREKFLLNLVKSGNKNQLDEMKKVFQDDKMSFCPFCLQDISNENKDNLIRLVEKILEDELKKHISEIKNSIKDPLQIDLSSFDKLTSEKKKCESVIEEINKKILENNSQLYKKFNNPYEPIKCKNNHINDLFVKLNEYLENLENKRKEYNKKINDVSQKQNELVDINNDIAYYDIIDTYNVYTEQLKRYEENVKVLNEKNEKMKDEQIRLENLQAEEKSIKIAVDEINKSLEYIFLARNRMKIVSRDNKYMVLINNKPVKPHQISVGERNILALSYFFVKVLNEKDNSYSDTYLIIIDDPVSSFDFENRIGILSFLRYKIEDILLGNNESKILILTHDLITVYDLHRGTESFIKYNKKNNMKFVFNDLELLNGSIADFRYKKRQEYTELLSIVYNYALKNDINQYDLIIGNIIRQILEAFTTFLYKSGIDIINDESIMQEFPNEKCKNHFKSLMAQIFLHGGSHREEQVKSIKDMNLFSCASVEEKIKIAQDIICFLYLINKQHILAHLGYSVEENVKKWAKSLC